VIVALPSRARDRLVRARGNRFLGVPTRNNEAAYLPVEITASLTATRGEGASERASELARDPLVAINSFIDK